jgi:Concanavalin A-like lectin/glucanases superfamily
MGYEEKTQGGKTMKLNIRLKGAIVIVLTMVIVEGWATVRIAGAQTGTWHVATDGSDTTGDGSEANPFATIQHGIDVASHGDIVLVHPGVYKENINFQGKDITVGSLFVSTGDEGYISQTLIDGDRQDHVITFENGETPGATLIGFTITNGYAHGAPAPEDSGGGIYCSYSSPTLTHLRVSGNEATAEGGGVYGVFCSLIIQDVTITNNLAGGGGGGIRYSYGSVNLESVIVAHNSAPSDGGGIQFYHAEGTVRNALIADNSGGTKGGGMAFDGSSPTFVNVTVVGNWASGHGGALNVSYMSQPTLVNSIVWGNSPEQIYFDMDWYGQAVTIEYSDIQGGQAGIVTNGLGPVYWKAGNKNLSPRFVRAGLGNYHLADNSPCLSAGRAEGAPATDIEGNPRPDPPDSNPDMGAYENASPPPVRHMVYLPIVSRAHEANDLVVWYDFEGDFVDSGLVVDRSGNGHDAQVQGTVDIAEGISGGHAIFFSREGYIQAQSNPAAGRTNVSFSLWFKTDNPGENYKLASAAWWNWGPGSGWIMATHIPEFWSDDTASLYLPDIINNDNGFVAGEWNYEVVTCDGDHIREYTNGQLVNDWPTIGAGIGQGQAMVVGAWPPFSAYDFYGSIDEFRIFARSLTQEEVEALYRQGP